MGRRRKLSRGRLAALGVCLALWAGAVAVRLLDLQVVRAAQYRDAASRQHESELDISPQRGAIRDRKGNDLAVSVAVDSLYALPGRVESPSRTAEFLSPILGVSVEDLYEKLTHDSFVYLKRKMTAAQAATIRDAALPGLGFEKESRRYYPNLQLAAHVLGPVNLDNHGIGGLEYYYDDVIAGTPGRLVRQRDARKVAFAQVERSPTEGASLTLTLDTSIQHFAEEEIGRTVSETSAVGMSVVVMDPRTGAILAMANYPTFNPNEYARFPESAWSNRAIKQVYEPGSTFKIVPAAAVLEEGLGSIDEIVDGSNGAIVVHGIRIRDHKPFGLLSMLEVLQYSSNVGIIRFGTRLSNTRFAEYIDRFGFGRPSGVDLMGEERGLTRPADEWSGLSSSMVSMGQEIGVTALQILNLMAAVGNGGVLYKPFVVARVEHVDGDVEETPPEGDRILDPNIASLLQDALRHVVTGGTGQGAAIPGYTAAGKTGTAQKIDPSTRAYSDTKVVASFAGYAPARDPSVAIVVVIDEPSGSQQYGGEIAAPVFGRLAGRILRYMEVAPDLPDELRYTEDDAEPVRTPEPQMERGLPAGGSAWGLVNASLPLPSTPSDGPARLVVPDYRGQTLREVFEDSQRMGLELVAKGSGVASQQWPLPGELVSPATRIQVRFSTSSGVRTPKSVP